MATTETTIESEIENNNIPPPLRASSKRKLDPALDVSEIPPRPAKLEREHKAEDEDELDEKDDKPAGGRGAMSPTLLKLKNQSDLEIKAWLDQIAGEVPLKVAVIRREPKFVTDPETGESKKTDGLCGSYDRTIDEDEIQLRHGGGTYQIVVRTRNAKGRWEYFAARTTELAGDPKLTDVPRAIKPGANQPVYTPPPPDPTTGKLLDRMFEIQNKNLEYERSERHRAPSGPSLAELQMLMRPLELQVESLTRLLAAKDAELAAARNAPADPFRDRMLSTLMDNESARITALRTQHEAEVRMLKEGFAQTEKNLRDQFQRDLDRVERMHDRELAQIKTGNEQIVGFAKHAADTQKTVLERELSALDKQLTKMDAELVALRAKKEQSFKEKFEEMNALKELVGGDEEAEESTFTKVIGAIGNLPAVVSMAERVGSGGKPQQQVQEAPKSRMVRDTTTGEVFIRTPQGMVPVKKKPQAITKESGEQVEIPAVDPDMVAQAVSFMEGAYRSGTDPKTFADSARPMVPPTVLGAIRTLGVTDFLIKVAKLDGTSALMTQSGRNWAKKVAAHLLGEEQPAPPTE